MSPIDKTRQERSWLEGRRSVVIEQVVVTDVSQHAAAADAARHTALPGTSASAATAADGATSSPDVLHEQLTTDELEPVRASPGDEHGASVPTGDTCPNALQPSGRQRYLLTESKLLPGYADHDAVPAATANVSHDDTASTCRAVNGGASHASARLTTHRRGTHGSSGIAPESGGSKPAATRQSTSAAGERPNQS